MANWLIGELSEGCVRSLKGRKYQPNRQQALEAITQAWSEGRMGLFPTPAGEDLMLLTCFTSEGKSWSICFSSGDRTGWLVTLSNIFHSGVMVSITTRTIVMLSITTMFVKHYLMGSPTKHLSIYLYTTIITVMHSITVYQIQAGDGV